MRGRATTTGIALLLMALLSSACIGRFTGGGFPNDAGPDDEIDRPAGPTVDFGEVPVEGSDETVTYRGFRNQLGGVCIESNDGSMSCGGGSEGGAPPVGAPLSMAWMSEGGAGGRQCVEMEMPDDIGAVTVLDAEDVEHVTRNLVGAGALGMNFFAACWLGGEPRQLQAYGRDGALAFRSDF